MLAEALQFHFQLPDHMTQGRNGLHRYTVPRSLVVGIGGSGCLAAQWAYAFAQDFFPGGQPEYIEFLGIDATGQATGAPVQLKGEDFLDISGFNANLYFQHAANFRFLDWLPVGGYLPGEITMGAHGKPHVGRLCYFMNRAGAICRSVQQKLAQLNRCPGRSAGAAPARGEHAVELEPYGRIVIHVTGSLCGGMGAGAILDLAFDLRRWCLEITGHPPLLVGHLVLPGAFQLTASDSAKQQHRTNAYALLVQINHFMGSHGATVQYKEGAAVRWEEHECPFDICFLLDGASDKSYKSRDAICHSVGRMIALLSCEYAGKQLWDAWDNIYTDFRSPGQDATALRVFSSYEIAVGTRPVHQLLSLVEGRVYQTLARLATPPAAASGGGGSVRQDLAQAAFRLQRSETELLAGFRQGLNRRTDANDNSYNTDAGGQAVKGYVESFLDDVPARARERLRGQTRNWFDGEADAFVEEKLATWLEQAPDMTQLPVYLQTLGNDLQARPRPATNVPGLEAHVRNLVNVHPTTSLFNPEKIAAVNDAVQQLLAARFEEARGDALDELALEVTARLNQRLRRLRELADECRRLPGVPPAEPAQLANGEIPLYALPIGHEGRIGGFDDRRLVHLLLLAVLRLPERPLEGYRRTIRRLLAGDPEIRAVLAHAVEDFFTEYEGRSGAQNWQDEHLQRGLQRLFQAAAPRWLLQRHNPIERTGCVVFPPEVPLDEVVRQEDGNLEPIPDGAYRGRALVVKTEHGAALADLCNLQDYEQAFQETLKKRRQEADFAEPHLWLDKNWNNVARPKSQFARRETDPGLVLFGLLLSSGDGGAEGESRIEYRPGGHQYAGADGTRIRLGKDWDAALETWLLPEHALLRGQLYAQLVEQPRWEQLLARVQVARVRVQELADKSDERSRKPLADVRRALADVVAEWAAQRGSPAAASSPASSPVPAPAAPAATPPSPSPSPAPAAGAALPQEAAISGPPAKVSSDALFGLLLNEGGIKPRTGNEVVDDWLEWGDAANAERVRQMFHEKSAQPLDELSRALHDTAEMLIKWSHDSDAEREKKLYRRLHTAVLAWLEELPRPAARGDGARAETAHETV